jgi:predicted nuclease of predicted toxin-antitoxin system
VKFLLDQNLSPGLVDGLAQAGHDALHVRDRGLSRADDPTVLAFAQAEGRILISADTDFGGLLARSGAERPSVILFRREGARRPAEQLRLLLLNLGQLAEALDAGSLIVITETLIRLDPLWWRA